MLKNRQEREIENANRQLQQYENQLRDIEIKVSELEQKNQQYTGELASINKQVQEKEKEVEEMSQKVRDIRLEHGSSDAKQVQLLEKKVREMLQLFFQNCKKHTVRKADINNYYSLEQQKSKLKKSQNQIEEGQDNSSSDLQNLSSDRKFLGQNISKQQNKQISKLSKGPIQQDQSFDFVIKVKNGQQINDVPIDLSQIKYVSNLRDYLSKTYSIQKEFLFLYDESGNMLLDDMELENCLFPNVFKTIKNYVPQLTIEVKRHKGSKQNGDSSFEYFQGEENSQNNNLKNDVKKLAKDLGSWEIFKKNFPRIIKHLLENLAILALIVLFILNRYISNDVINKYNLNLQANNFISDVIKNNDNPFSIYDSSTLIALVQFQQILMNAESTFTTAMTSIMYQKRVKVKKECNIPANHKLLFDFGNKQNCVDVDSYDQSAFGDKTQSYYKYSTVPGTDISGFILYSHEIQKKFPSTDTDNFAKYFSFLKNDWFDFQTYEVMTITNFYNSPTGMALQLKTKTTNIVTDRKIAELNYSVNSFSVLPETQSEKITSNFITGIASFLLLFAFIEYVGIYGQNTKNINVELYKKRKNDYFAKKEQELLDQNEFEKNFGSQEAEKNKKKQGSTATIEPDHQFFIIDLSWLYILIKRPEFFDIINIVSLILLLVQSNIYSSFRKNREGIIKPDDSNYVDFDPYIQDEFIIMMLTAVNTLLLMLSFTKYLASWSFTLKIYSQIMTQFVKKSWAILVMILGILFTISFCWMIFISGSIQNHESLIYSLFLHIKATFYSSFIQELRIKIEDQPEMPPLVKDSVFNPFPLIALLILQFVIHITIFSFLASLMANNIHVIKENMNKIYQEMKFFEKKNNTLILPNFQQSSQRQQNRQNGDQNQNQDNRNAQLKSKLQF